jgi:hypothetical protein
MVFNRIFKLHDSEKAPESAEAPWCAAYFCGLNLAPLQATQAHIVIYDF